MNWSKVRDHGVLLLKRTAYGRKGEPYDFAGRTLRFVPGARPIRLKYLHVNNWVNRDDALQVLWIDEHLREGDIALDIGAHYGIYSVLMAAKCGVTGHVVAFEPDPHVQEILKRNLSLNPDVKRPIVEAVACSDIDGEAILFSGGGHNAQSSLARTGARLIAEEIHVRTVSLDGYLTAHGLNPNVVKIDAEGAEIRILKGARELLASDAEVLCELHPYAWAEFGNTDSELRSLVADGRRRIRYLDRTREADTLRYGMTALER
jgi:FkbM family methyltransferase